ncbi:MAG: ATP-binding cassette domain-containing protein [Verrucomicrobia bacterium]|nr:ATP-binding cassette domain-containing protein [Verrucomicrobiota bacterium]
MAVTGQENTVISAHELLLQFNDYKVLQGATASFGERDKVGLVGLNGTGKSSFLKILAGQMKPDGGEIHVRRRLRTHYLPQDTDLDHSLNVRENIRRGAGELLNWLRDYESADGYSSHHAELDHLIQSVDGWNLDYRIRLLADNLRTPDLDSSCENLSGGEKRRVCLARAIVGLPEFLLLDEPTNHLDPDSIEWLAEFLRQYKGGFLLVTHDRYFLDQVCNRILELATGILHAYEGNYSTYILAKSERLAIAQKNEDSRQNFLRREVEWVRRGPKARTTKSKSRLDRYEEVASMAGPEQDKDVELVIPPAPPLANRIVEMQNVSVSFGDRCLFKEFSFEFEPGTKIGITGRNGLGKSTLLRLITGSIQPTSGSVFVGDKTQINYIDQNRTTLNPDNTILEEVGEGSDWIQFGASKMSVRAYMKRFLFDDSRIGSRISRLSGGEKSRVALAKTLKSGGNFLILDEPTNDLDLATLRILEQGLEEFDGCVLVVSHDRYFLNRICDGILAFEGDGHIHYSVGNLDYYYEKRKERLKSPKPGPSPAADDAEITRTRSPQTAPAGRKLTYKEKKELAEIEDKVMMAEQVVEELEAKFADPDFHEKYASQLDSLNSNLLEARHKVSLIYQRWEELELIRQSIDQIQG